MVTGDFNIYASTEPAYSALVDQSTPGYFVDIFDLPGVWNDAAYAPYHTQSTRTRQFGGGANGGLDDRFDMILMSQSIIDTGGVHYVNNSYLPYGNDGLHYNDSINKPPNLAVGQVIADALHYSSDHLPVIAGFTFQSGVPVELISFTAYAENGGVRLTWITSTETNNKGFWVERSQRSNPPARLVSDESERAGEAGVKSQKWEPITFIKGEGTSTEAHSYSYIDKNVLPGEYLYRLRQEDFDGSYKYSGVVIAFIGSPLVFSLEQNFPNPFNPTTKIRWQSPAAGRQTLKVFDVLGDEVATLVNEEKAAGTYEVNFRRGDLPSGVYFYQLIVGNYVQVRKMILLK